MTCPFDYTLQQLSQYTIQSPKNEIRLGCLIYRIFGAHESISNTNPVGRLGCAEDIRLLPRTKRIQVFFELEVFYYCRLAKSSYVVKARPMEAESS